MDFLDTIKKPWNQPLSYIELAFWFAVFLIVAFAILDSLRVVTSFVAETATGG